MVAAALVYLYISYTNVLVVHNRTIYLPNLPTLFIAPSPPPSPLSRNFISHSDFLTLSISLTLSPSPLPLPSTFVPPRYVPTRIMRVGVLARCIRACTYVKHRSAPEDAKPLVRAARP